MYRSLVEGGVAPDDAVLRLKGYLLSPDHEVLDALQAMTAGATS
jgi:hypothetical protein